MGFFCIYIKIKAIISRRKAIIKSYDQPFSIRSLHFSISHFGVLVAPQMPTVRTSGANHDMSISSGLSI